MTGLDLSAIVGSRWLPSTRDNMCKRNRRRRRRLVALVEAGGLAGVG